MGYYVQIIRSTAKIPAANLKRSYQKMCALNSTHHKDKRGGSYEGGKKVQTWFSFMAHNYTEICKDAKAVLEEARFYTDLNEQGDLLITGFDGKMGQEDLFLDAIENEAEGEIEWLGEEGERWTTVFKGSDVIDAQEPTRLLAN